MDDQPCRKVATYTKQHKHKRGQTSISRVGFEPTIPVFKLKIFHPLDRAATVIGENFYVPFNDAAST
jgi:hypothetical protein